MEPVLKLMQIEDDFDKNLTVFMNKEEKSGKLYDMHQYTHYCGAEELEEKLENLLCEFKEIPNRIIKQFDGYHKFYKNYLNEVNLIESRLSGLQALIVVFIVNLRSFGQNLSESEIELLIDEYVKKNLNFNHKLHKMSEMMNRFKIIASDHAHIDTDVILQIVKGSKNICTSAVSIVVNIAFKIFKHLEVALEDIKNYPKNTEYNMELMRYSGLLAKIFDAIYAASLDDPNDIFYQEEPNDDIKRLVKSIKYHEPGDKDDHFRRFENFSNFFNFVMSVGVNALSHRNLCSVALSGLYNATYYKLFSSTRKTRIHGDFGFAFPNTEMMDYMLQLKNRFKFDNKEKKIKLKVNKTIYIPICKDDEITLDTLESTETPFMIENEVDCEFISNVDRYNQTENVKVRIISDYDIFDFSKDKFEFEAIILDIHGGGFMNGSSNKNLQYTVPYAKYSKCPVFSIDYRLAPDYKFPVALSDCWQVYLWLVKYSKRYLNFSFEKIILEGDSAGGNFCYGLTTLSIQRNVKIPDGLMLNYPASSCSMDSFAPSIMCSLDSVMLNISYMKIILEYYTGESADIQKHYLVSPKFTPERILARYPPCRFLIGGIDPLRDDTLRIALKLIKQDVDVQIMEYRYCLHGLMGHTKYPFSFKEPQDSIKITSDYINGLIDIQ